MQFRCPTCSQLMECADNLAGTKASCPKCRQKVLIPTPSKPTPTNKTTLGKLEDEPLPLPTATPAPPALETDADLFEVPSPNAPSQVEPEEPRKQRPKRRVPMTRCHQCGDMIPVSEAFRVWATTGTYSGGGVFGGNYGSVYGSTSQLVDYCCHCHKYDVERAKGVRKMLLLAALGVFLFLFVAVALLVFGLIKRGLWREL